MNSHSALLVAYTSQQQETAKKNYAMFASTQLLILTTMALKCGTVKLGADHIPDTAFCGTSSKSPLEVTAAGSIGLNTM